MRIIKRLKLWYRLHTCFECGWYANPHSILCKRCREKEYPLVS